jgi:hypothetical protein
MRHVRPRSNSVQGARLAPLAADQPNYLCLTACACEARSSARLRGGGAACVILVINNRPQEIQDEGCIARHLRVARPMAPIWGLEMAAAAASGRKWRCCATHLESAGVGVHALPPGATWHLACSKWCLSLWLRLHPPAWARASFHPAARLARAWQWRGIKEGARRRQQRPEQQCRGAPSALGCRRPGGMAQLQPALAAPRCCPQGGGGGRPQGAAAAPPAAAVPRPPFYRLGAAAASPAAAC